MLRAALEEQRQRADRSSWESGHFVASIDDLIAMKGRTGRPQDLLDISESESIRGRCQR